MQPHKDLPRPISDWAPSMTRDSAKPIKFMFNPAWKLPREGVLELDFVLWKRAPKPVYSGPY